MGLLGQMYRLYTVATSSDGAGPGDRRPAQLCLDEARRRLEMAAEDTTVNAALLQRQARDLEKMLADRNAEGQRMEDMGHEDGAVELYEENVSDMYAGSFPYSRLIDIYERRGEKGEAQRVARSCLAHALQDLPADVRATCLGIIARAEQHK